MPSVASWSCDLRCIRFYRRRKEKKAFNEARFQELKRETEQRLKESSAGEHTSGERRASSDAESLNERRHDGNVTFGLTRSRNESKRSRANPG